MLVVLVLVSLSSMRVEVEARFESGWGSDSSRGCSVPKDGMTQFTKLSKSRIIVEDSRRGSRKKIMATDIRSSQTVSASGRRLFGLFETVTRAVQVLILRI